MPYANTYNNYSITLFGKRASSSVTLNNGRMRIYSCQIYKNNLLVRNFIPAKDGQGVACLYDKVTDTFFYNQGTGDFSYGNNLAKVGDVIKHQTKWLGIKKGQIMQMKFNLNSNKLVAEAKVKDLE